MTAIQRLCAFAAYEINISKIRLSSRGQVQLLHIGAEHFIRLLALPWNALAQRMMELRGPGGAVLHTAAAEPAFIGIGTSGGLPLSGLGQYRTNELVRRRMNFSSDAMADFEGLLEVNRKICQQQMAEKASPTLPTNCAVLP